MTADQLFSAIGPIVALVGATLTAAVTYYITKKQQIDKEWRDAKINHYKVLISSISDLAVEVDKKDALIKFAHAVNTISLVAPQYVVLALMNFHDEVKPSSVEKKPENHDKLLIDLLLAIRRDINIPEKEDPKTFKFHLVGPPQNNILSIDKNTVSRCVYAFITK